MKVKKYLVNNMNEAIAKMRQELGSEAIIISQRKVKKPGLMGFFSPKLIEVTAASGTKAAQRNNYRNNTNSDTSMEDSIKAIQNLLSDKQAEPMGGILGDFNLEQNTSHKIKTNEDILREKFGTVKKENLNNENEDILKEVREMKQLINSLSVANGTEASSEDELIVEKRKSIHDALDKLDIGNEFSDRIVEAIIDKNYPEEISINDAIKLELGEYINVEEPKDAKVEVLIGPTGVGKTTTIAKLAGRKALVEKKSVGLITIDTYRIGAVEQLKTYSEIMNIPFRVVFSMKEMEGALNELKDCDVILVDTTGRSAKNKMQISELRAYIDKIKEKKIHLVLSSIIKSKDVKTIIEGYSSIEFDSVIVTKLDETSTYGVFIDIENIAKKPISYITIGQSVPDDIQNANKEFILELVCGERSI